jgi:hypothetical protein
MFLTLPILVATLAVGAVLGLTAGYYTASRVWRSGLRSVNRVHELELHDLRVGVDQLRKEIVCSESRADDLRRENDALWTYKRAMDEIEEGIEA